MWLCWLIRLLACTPSTTVKYITYWMYAHTWIVVGRLAAGTAMHKGMRAIATEPVAQWCGKIDLAR